jgi:hypothetical protein
VDDDGNVVLVVCNLTASHTYNCTIINEVAENSTSCHVEVAAEDQPIVQLDEDIIR